MQSEIILVTFDDQSSCIVDMDYERILFNLDPAMSRRVVGQEWIKTQERTSTFSGPVERSLI